MSKYCFRCGKESKTKCNLNKHLRNKKECDIIYLDVSREEIIKNYNLYIEDFLVKKEMILGINKGRIDNIKHNIKHNSKGDNIIVCEYCDKRYSYKTSYYRHKKYYCDGKREMDDKNRLVEKFLNTKYNLLKIEYEEKLNKTKDELNEKLKENDKIKEKLGKKIKKLETQIEPNYFNTNIKNINNGNINNNITIINNYGEEKFKMRLEDCEEIMSYEFNMIVKLIEYIHIIPPENRNAFLPSLKEKYAMILKNQKWDLVDRKDFIDNLIINKNIMLEKMLEEYGSQFKNINSKRSKSVINYCKNDNEEYQRIKTDATLLLFNNKDMIKDTYKEKYNKNINSR